MQESLHTAAESAGDAAAQAVAADFTANGIAPWRVAANGIIVRSVDTAVEWLQRHWLALFSGGLGLIVGGALLTPALYALGAAGVASRLFTAYHLICAQIPTHSYFLFGYQLALCARNLAIYSALLGGTLLFRSVRDWLPPLHWSLWLLTMAPMAWDGFTQMFGWRESTWELRTLTGVLFGLGVCWFVLPRLERASHDVGASDSAANHKTAISLAAAH